MKKKLFLPVCTAICLIACIISGLLLLREWRLKKDTSMQYQALSSSIPASRRINVSKREIAIKSPKLRYSTEKELRQRKKSRYLTLYKMNGDFTGWIQIPNTNINYPVMQTTKGNKNFYIDKDFNKNPNVYGTPYIDERCLLNKSKNIVILYGHHMKDGTMFAQLSNYKHKQFYEKHSEFEMDYFINGRLTEDVYRIFAVITIKDIDKMNYSYYDIDSLSSNSRLFKKQYMSYISALKSDSLYSTGFTPKKNCPLILLSTCDYSGKNGRMIIAGYKVSS